jgi:hypothetical protein
MTSHRGRRSPAPRCQFIRWSMRWRLGRWCKAVAIWVRLDQLAAGDDEPLAGADDPGSGEQAVAEDRCEHVDGVAGGQHVGAGQGAGGEGEGAVGCVAEQPAMGVPVQLAVGWADRNLQSAPEFVEQVLVEGHQPALGDLAVGDAEHPDGLPGPQPAVALQLAVGQLHRPLLVGQDGV